MLTHTTGEVWSLPYHTNYEAVQVSCHVGGWERICRVQRGTDGPRHTRSIREAQRQPISRHSLYARRGQLDATD